MTYAQLVTKLQDWWESTEATFVAEVDTFIEHGELRIYRSVDLQTTRTGDGTLVITEGNAVITIPTAVVVLTLVEWWAPASASTTLLEQKDISFIQDFNAGKLEGALRYYAWETDIKLQVAPIPDATAAAGTLAINYTSRPTQLASGQTTTWLSLNAPDLLFYSCMLEVLTFQKAEADTIADYTGKYQQALQAVLMEENMRNRTDSYRTGEIRMGL